MTIEDCIQYANEHILVDGLGSFKKNRMYNMNIFFKQYGNVVISIVPSEYYENSYNGFELCEEEFIDVIERIKNTTSLELRAYNVNWNFYKKEHL